MQAKNLVFPFFALLLTFKGVTQNSLKKEIVSLHNIVSGFIEKDDAYYEGRKSEFIVMVIELDSSGAVKEIHLLADKNNIDSSFAILERMKSEHFMGRVFELWKSKTLNLAVYSLTHKRKDNYVAEAIIHPKTVFDSRTAVMIPPLYYLTPADNETIRRASNSDNETKNNPQSINAKRKDGSKNRLTCLD